MFFDSFFLRESQTPYFCLCGGRMPFTAIRTQDIGGSTGVSGAAMLRSSRLTPSSNVPDLERDSIICAYSAQVRIGLYGRGATVKVQTVTDALSAISQTIQLAGKRSLLYRTDQKQYNLTIERMVEGFRWEDPPSVPQLAVPITVPKACFTASCLQDNP